MSVLNWPPKDPDEILDYSLNWSGRLNGDTIATSSWTIADTSLIRASATFSNTSATIWLSGGTVNSTPVAVTSQITTAGGRTMNQTVYIKIVNK